MESFSTLNSQMSPRRQNVWSDTGLRAALLLLLLVGGGPPRPRWNDDDWQRRCRRRLALLTGKYFHSPLYKISLWSAGPGLVVVVGPFRGCGVRRRGHRVAADDEGCTAPRPVAAAARAAAAAPDRAQQARRTRPVRGRRLRLEDGAVRGRPYALLIYFGLLENWKLLGKYVQPCPLDLCSDETIRIINNYTQYKPIVQKLPRTKTNER